MFDSLPPNQLAAFFERSQQAGSALRGHHAGRVRIEHQDGRLETGATRNLRSRTQQPAMRQVYAIEVADRECARLESGCLSEISRDHDASTSISRPS
jgi:hypothetical protein